MIEISCANCGAKKMVRTADVKRGWGKFCSKSCKASHQERRTGQYYNYRGSGVSRDKYFHYAREHGGTPEFDRNGEYVGFTGPAFSEQELTP